MGFIQKGKNQKIKNSTLCNDYQNGGLKNVDKLSVMPTCVPCKCFFYFKKRFLCYS